MTRLTILLAALTVALLAGCADSLVDDAPRDRPPAPFSPDSTANLPQTYSDVNHARY
ncbi:MAG: hypothetical protein ABI992_11300 [Chthoniobacterales bacterium]